MHRLFAFFIFFGFLLILESCIQDDDRHDPEIVFMEPIAGYTVYMPDTLDVKVEIKDDQVIRTVVLSIVNENKIPVISANYYYPNSSEFYIETSLALDDKTLESGPYQLLVTASDGVNSKDKYRKIIINEIPVRILAYIAVTGQITIKSTILKLNPAFATDTQFVFPEGYWLAGVHSLWEKFFFISDEPSILTAFNPENFKTEWEIAAEPPRPLITQIFPDQELVFSTANGDAGILSDDGTITLRTAPAENKTIQCLAADDKYIYAAHVSLSGDIHQLTVYYRVSGDIREQKLLAGEIISIVPIADKVLVFMPSPSGTGIMEYDPEELTLAQISFLQDEVLRSVMKISESRLFLLTDTRVISYEPAINRFTDFINQPYNFCRYDPLNNNVFLVKENLLSVFNYATGNLVKETSFADEVLDFQILYNK